MWKMSPIKITFLLLLLGFTGCAPRPPVDPFGIELSLLIFIATLLIALGIFLFLKNNTEQLRGTNHSYLTDTLNNVNSKLKELEERIKKLENNSED